jgi:hypothetical protein
MSVHQQQVSDAVAWYWSGNGCSATVTKDDLLYFYEVRRGDQFFRGARRTLRDARAEANLCPLIGQLTRQA